jgi:hypothetical protein
VRLAQVSEVIHQVGIAQIVDLMVEVRAGAANGAAVGLNRLRLQPLELQVLLMQQVVALKVRNIRNSACGRVFRLALASRSSWISLG